ncbi:MAG: TIR domain-containing protein [Anaerolineae bacterium]|nr:TIR domain-containing protein [Anaerolineae bacterium]
MESGSLVLVVVIIVLIVVAVVIWRRFKSNADKPTTEIHTVAQKSLLDDNTTEPLERNQTKAQVSVSDVAPGALAVLEVEQGPDALVNGINMGRFIEIREQRVTIGRSPKQATIQLYDVDEVSSVSRLHCTLEFHRSLKCFLITDEGSSSGTKVAGKSIMPHKGHSLKDGDQIELGMIDQQGAILRFRTTFDSPTRRLSVEPLVEPKDTIRKNMNAVGRTTAHLKQDVFISYSRRDRDVMRIVRGKLLAAGFTVWSDENLEPGSPSWKNDVQQAIEGASSMVAIMSPDAKGSEWVSEELNYARIHKLRVFTVLVRGDESNAIPFGLTGVQWVDMRGDYDAGMKEIMQQSALEQLVGAVKEHLGR